MRCLGTNVKEGFCMKRLFQRTAALLCAALLLVASPSVHAAGEDPFTVLFIGVDTSGKAAAT